MFICSTLVTIVCNVHNDQIVDESHSQCGEFVQSWRWKTNEKIETFQFFYENATILNEWNMHLSDKRKKKYTSEEEKHLNYIVSVWKIISRVIDELSYTSSHRIWWFLQIVHIFVSRFQFHRNKISPEYPRFWTGLALSL